MTRNLKSSSLRLFWLRLFSISICSIGLLKTIGIIFFIRVVGLADLVPPSGLTTVLSRQVIEFFEHHRCEILCLSAFLLIVSILLVICGIFSFFRKSWARKILISVIVLEILSSFAIMTLLWRFSVRFTGIEGLIGYVLALLYVTFFLTRKEVVQLFAKEEAGGET